MLLFYIPLKHQKNLRFSGVFRGYRKAILGCNGLTWNKKTFSIIFKRLSVAKNFLRPESVLLNLKLFKLLHNYTIFKLLHIQHSGKCYLNLTRPTANSIFGINHASEAAVCRLRCQCQWRRSIVFIVNFEHISHLVLVFLSLTLNM